LHSVSPMRKTKNWEGSVRDWRLSEGQISIIKKVRFKSLRKNGEHGEMTETPLCERGIYRLFEKTQGQI
jgi:hypothetical protein